MCWLLPQWPWTWFRWLPAAWSLAGILVWVRSEGSGGHQSGHRLTQGQVCQRSCPLTPSQSCPSSPLHSIQSYPLGQSPPCSPLPPSLLSLWSPLTMSQSSPWSHLASSQSTTLPQTPKAYTNTVCDFLTFGKSVQNIVPLHYLFLLANHIIAVTFLLANHLLAFLSLQENLLITGVSSSSDIQVRLSSKTGKQKKL